MFCVLSVVVRKGLIVLQLFASPKLTHEETTRHRIVTIIFSALKNFSDVKGVQTEVCLIVNISIKSDWLEL